MQASEDVHNYQASMVPGEEPPTYAWAAERLVAGAQRLADVFAVVGSIRERSVSKQVTVTTVRGEETGHTGREFKYPDISTREERIELGVRASEMIHHLRASLDHFAFVSAWKQHGEPRKGTGFPICSGLDDWQDGRVRRQIRLMTPDAKAAVEAIQPFKGVEWSRKLRDLSNMDKHRQAIVLSPTVRWTCPVHVSDLREHPLPTDISVNLMLVDDLSLRFQDEAKEMFDGAVQFLNPFLVVEGHDEIAVQWNF